MLSLTFVIAKRGARFEELSDMTTTIVVIITKHRMVYVYRGKLAMDNSITTI